MKNIETRIITTQEFYDLLKSNKEFTKTAIGELNDIISAVKSCSDVTKTIFGERVICNVPKMSQLLQTNPGKVKFIKILKATFGKNFFNDMTSEELKEARKEKRYTKYDLDKVLKPGFGKMYGYDFKRPENWEEFALYVQNCFNVYKDSRVIDQVKIKYHELFLILKTLFETTFARNSDVLNKYLVANKFYNKFMDSFEKKQKISLTDDEVKEIKTVLNCIDSCFYDESDGELSELGFGDAFIEVAKTYNDDLDAKLLNKKENISIKEDKNLDGRTKVQKYFDILKEKNNIKSIVDSDLPSYEDEDFEIVMKELMELFFNEKNCSYICGVLSGHLIGYRHLKWDLKFIDDEMDNFKTYN